MEASQATSRWAGELTPPFLDAPVQDRRSPEERFETEAMPHLNDLFAPRRAQD